jgi:hypothetical protein
LLANLVVNRQVINIKIPKICASVKKFLLSDNLPDIFDAPLDSPFKFRVGIACLSLARVLQNIFSCHYNKFVNILSFVSLVSTQNLKSLFSLFLAFF